MSTWKCGKGVFEYRERFGASEGQDGGSVPEMGSTLIVIGHLRCIRPQVILNRLNAKPQQVLDISALGDLKDIGDKYALLIYMWEGTQSRVFNDQLLAPSLKELHLIEVSVAFTSFNSAFVKVLDTQELIADISVGGMRQAGMYAI